MAGALRTALVALMVLPQAADSVKMRIEAPGKTVARGVTADYTDEEATTKDYPEPPEAAREVLQSPYFIGDWRGSTAGLSLSILIGMDQQQKLFASIIAITAFFAVLGGTITASVLTTVNPELCPEDFSQKGTLSNVCQNVASPHGRLWATALLVSAVLLFASMYPFWIYRSWASWVDRAHNPVLHGSLQSSCERVFRTIWVVVPNVGFMLTAAIPSLSGVSGYELVLTGVHNVCAPLSMLFCMLMETVQLQEENAFSYFFSSEPTPVWGPLTPFQRIRAVVVMVGWTSGIIFVSVQGYLFLYENKSRRTALVSYFGEVIGLVLAFAMPMLAGVENIAGALSHNKSAVEQATEMITEHLSGKNQLS